MAAFTRLSPLHISLPIRLTTRIHSHWLFILLYFSLLQMSSLSILISSLIFNSSHKCISLCSTQQPSLLHLVYSTSIFCLSPSLYVHAFLLLLPSFVPFTRTRLSSLHSFYTFWLTKEDRIRQEWQRSDIKRMSGHTGTHNCRTRRLCGRSFVPCLQRERVSVCMCWHPYNYICVGRLFWYACSCFCVQALT